MGLLKPSSCRLVWNMEKMEVIIPTRGLRQGDPLSPYQFVMCIERLSHWILKMIKEGVWRPLLASRGEVKISHLLFADDILLFAEAREDQVIYIKDELTRFCGTLGKLINFNKSLMFFSSNISKPDALRLSTNWASLELLRWAAPWVIRHPKNF